MIPKSSYRLVPSYFKVRLVEDFHDKYLDYLIELDGYSKQELQQEGASTIALSWEQKSDQGELQLYMYPEEFTDHHYSVQTSKIMEQEADFFEREDANWVIPRHLFEPILDK